MSLLVIDDVRCPWCGAAPGRPCRTVGSKKKLARPHKHRLYAFRAARGAPGA